MCWPLEPISLRNDKHLSLRLGTLALLRDVKQATPFPAKLLSFFLNNQTKILVQEEHKPRRGAETFMCPCI